MSKIEKVYRVYDLLFFNESDAIELVENNEESHKESVKEYYTIFEEETNGSCVDMNETYCELFTSVEGLEE